MDGSRVSPGNKEYSIGAAPPPRKRSKLYVPSTTRNCYLQILHSFCLHLFLHFNVFSFHLPTLLGCLIYPSYPHYEIKITMPSRLKTVLLWL